jgi:hypothetical protein
MKIKSVPFVVARATQIETTKTNKQIEVSSTEIQSEPITDYKQAIQEYLDKEDWYNVMILAAKARKENADKEAQFGTIEGVISIFNRPHWYGKELEEFLNLAGFTVYKGNYNHILKRVDKGELKPDTTEGRIAIITSSDTMKARLDARNFLSIQYQVDTPSDVRDFYWGISTEKVATHFHIKNTETGKVYDLSEVTAKSTFREMNMMSIFED